MSKYVPNLLPNESKFDIDENEILEDKKNNINRNEFLRIWSYFLFIFFFISSLAFIFTRFWQGLLILLIAFIILPQGHNWTEKNFVLSSRLFRPRLLA